MARVLVIDDDLMLNRLIGEHLMNEGFEVTSASMAEEGFEKAVQSPPDLIMLDVQLPDATGFQTCGKLRQNPITRSIPIIMMTGSAKNDNQASIGRMMGANDYVLKPFNVIEVGDRVHHLLGSKPPVRDAAPPPKMLGNSSPTSIIKEEHPTVAQPFENSVQTQNFMAAILNKPYVPMMVAAVEAPPAPQAPRRFVPAAPTTPALRVTESTLKIKISLPSPFRPLADNPFEFKEALKDQTEILTPYKAKPLIASEALREFFQIFAWTSTPLIFRSFLKLLGALFPSVRSLHALALSKPLPSETFWIRPLDAFELAALVIFGLALHRKMGRTPKQCLWATAALAATWIFITRSSLLPF